LADFDQRAGIEKVRFEIRTRGSDGGDLLLYFYQCNLRESVVESGAGFIERGGVSKDGSEEKRPEAFHDLRYLAR
jgi:hypothetical protein